MDGLEDLERRISRLETLTDSRLVTRDVFDVWGQALLSRLDKGEENDTWLIRFVVMSLVGVIANAVFLAVTYLGR